MKKILSDFLVIILAMTSVIGILVTTSATITFAYGYNGSTYEGSGTEKISYFTKTDNEEFINGALPQYYNSGNYTNTCANVAGAIILGYYDKDLTDLIPDFTSARIIRDKILYFAQTPAVQKVIDDLYYKMKTNSTGNGTTVKQFKTGLEQYVNEKQQNVTYSPIVQNEQIDIDAYTTAIKQELPVVLFVSKYTMIPISDLKEDNTTDIYNESYYGGDHVLIGYGLRRINYYNADGSLKKEVVLLRAATGYNQDPLVYIELDERIRVIDGYKIKIY